MKALSVRQPWPWFMFCGQLWAKDVENRNWPHLLKNRGNILIHASLGMTKKEFDEACALALTAGATILPRFEDLKRGGIVGMVRVVDHVRHHPSKWFVGPTAFVLTDPYPLPFRRCKGALGFFEPDYSSEERSADFSRQQPPIDDPA